VNRARILDALPGSAASIRRSTGLGAATVHKWIHRMLAAGEIHAARTAPGRTKPTTIYARGLAPAGMRAADPFALVGII
jgi:hypothetical protein